MKRYAYKKIYRWTPAIAYVTGLIASDGCLINNGRHLNVTSKDIEIIDNVQKILNMNLKVPTKNSGFGGIGYHFQFSNASFYDFLLKAGLTPAKSKTLGPITLPDEFYPDFLRGYFDGDGSIHGFWDVRWKNSLMFYTDFYSASIPFLLWLRDTNIRLIEVSQGSFKTSVRVSGLNYAKADSRKLFKFMYYSSDLPCLSRKKHKFIDFLTLDPYANIVFPARVLESVDRLV